MASTYNDEIISFEMTETYYFERLNLKKLMKLKEVLQTCLQQIGQGIMNRTTGQFCE